LIVISARIIAKINKHLILDNP